MSTSSIFMSFIELISASFSFLSFEAPKKMWITKLNMVKIHNWIFEIIDKISLIFNVKCINNVPIQALVQVVCICKI